MKDLQEDQQTPWQTITIVAGDRNYVANGDTVIQMQKIAKDEGIKAGVEIVFEGEDLEGDGNEGTQRAIEARRPGQVFWDKMLESCCDCDPGCPTR